MLAKDHIQLSILSASLPILFLIVSLDINENTKIGSLIIFMIGVFIGSLLPDTDLDESKIDHMYKYKINTQGLNIINKIMTKIFISLLGIFTFLFGKITKYILNPIVAILFGLVLHKSINRNHRGITHSLFGVLLNCLLIGGLFLVIWKLDGVCGWGIINDSFWYFSCLLVGLFIGEVFHLLEDSCTISGISPFYPIWGGKISGNIRTGESGDLRPIYYACIIIGVYIGVGMLAVYKIPDNLWFLLALSSFIISWTIIMVASRSKIN